MLNFLIYYSGVRFASQERFGQSGLVYLMTTVSTKCCTSHSSNFIYIVAVQDYNNTLLTHIDLRRRILEQQRSSTSSCKRNAQSTWNTNFKVEFTHISTFIEGGKYTFDEVQALVVFGTPASSKTELEAWEVEDHAVAWEFVMTKMTPKPLAKYTVRDVLEIHHYLTRRLLPSANGKFRDREVC
jgi:hypothetical protein